MELMADLAIAFRWPPSELWEMDLVELRRWHELAKARMPKRGGK
jgi:hypothetical protein